MNPKSEGFIPAKFLIELPHGIIGHEKEVISKFLGIDKDHILDWELTALPQYWGIFITKLRLK